MHEFLNAFAGAIITNRTLLWAYCDRSYCETPISECEKSLLRHNWIASADEIIPRLQHANCYSTFGVNDKWYWRWISYFSFKKNANNDIVIPHRDNEHVKTACCGLDTLANKVVNFGILGKQIMKYNFV